MVQPQLFPASRRRAPEHPDAFAAASARLRAERRIRNSSLRRLASGLGSKPPEAAELELREYVSSHPNDPDGLWLLAKTVLDLGRRREAAGLLQRCVSQDPDFSAAQYEYAHLLFQLHKFSSALAETDRLLKVHPQNPLVRQLKANILESLGNPDQTLAIREQLLTENLEVAEAWVNYGHALRGRGLKEKSAAAYRKAFALRPSCGMAYWALANMKTVRFSEAEIAVMLEQSRRADIPADDRVPLQFALGKAYEDLGMFPRSFEEYAKANAAMRLRLGDSPDDLRPRAQSNRAVFTPEFLSSREGAGAGSTAPIFVVGKPRSGTTLIEQILSTHSMIEGTGELPYISSMATQLREERGGDGIGYPDLIAEIDLTEFRHLGEQYLESASIHRKEGKPFFVDKKPANHFHIGLIHLILPNARVIDARRNPAACCFSMFKQYFSKTNLRLSELAQNYRDYVELMAHFDAVLPGKIHRVIYEQMVADPETETRRLLDYLELPFEQSCLRFYETRRAVLTPSSEQVRRPITQDAVDYWRHFEPWLGPLIQSLGSVLTEYPRPPHEFC